MLHGLSADRRVMMYLGSDFAGHGFRTYLFDLAGHGDNTDPFTFPRAEQCAAVAIDSLTRSGAIDPRKTILLGHSMGGEIAVRMADHDPVAATIALSPAPMTLPQRMPSNLLVIAGGLDLWPVKSEARALAAAAGGDRTASSDFAEQRAFQLVILPYATHTTGLVDRGVAHRAELWAMQALFPSVPPNTLALNLDLATYQTCQPRPPSPGWSDSRADRPRAAVSVCSHDCIEARWASKRGLSSARPSRALAAAEGATGALAAVLILSLGVPLRFLHLYAGDYLASLLPDRRPLSARTELESCAGILVTALTADPCCRSACVCDFSRDRRVAQLATRRHVDERAALAALRRASAHRLHLLFRRRSRSRRCHDKASRARCDISSALVLRLELWLACLLAYYRLANAEVLILILFFALAGFSALQRLATDALRARTGSAIGAALFGAILAAWFVAAIFPLT